MSGSSERANMNNVLMIPENSVDIDISTGDHVLTQPAVLYVGTGGDVKVRMKNGQDALFKNVPDGYQLAAVVDTVHQTGTTATNILGLW